MLASCNTPLLTEISGPVFGSRSFAYGAAGHLEIVDRGANVVRFQPDDEGRTAEARRTDDTDTTTFATSTFTYDGRSYLRQATDPVTGAAAEPLYSSDGLLHALTRQDSSSDPATTYHLFHFAGRPVAQVVSGATTDTWWYLTTDHLGTPMVATDGTGAEVWAGPLEPFGRDPQAGLPAGALENGVFLRFPGQWEDESWEDASMGAEVYYNVHRWYQPGTGRYTKADPLGIVAGDINPYLYALSNPIIYIDEFGLATFKNFPPGKKEEAERALQEALQKLKDQPCCTGSQELTEELQAKLSDPDLVIVYKPQLKACGQTPFLANVFGRLRMQLGPLAFDPVLCCDLSSTMVHEASHIGLGGSESDAQQIEKDCFNCPRGR